MHRVDRQNEDVSALVRELTADSPACEQPSHASDIQLRPHQLTLLHRCLELERGDVPVLGQPDMTMRTQIGIIGDKVGAGKSYVMLALAMSDDSAHTRATDTFTYGNAYQVTVRRPDNARYQKTTLLAVPHVLAAQWTGYCDAFFRPGGAHRVAIVTNKKSLDGLLTLDDDGRDERGNRLEDYDLIVVTSTHYNLVAAFANTRGVRFRRVIFDEADVVSIASCVRPMAAFTWFVSASFLNLVYPRGHMRYIEGTQRWQRIASGVAGNAYVRSVFTSLLNMPGEQMATLIAKNCEQFVGRSIQLPELIEQTILCRACASVRVLDGLVSSNILEHLNAGDTQGALQCISANHKGTQDSIIRTLIDKLERERQNLVVRLDTTSLMVYDTDAEREEDRRRLQAKLQEVTHKISSIEARVRQANICNICYEEFDGSSAKTVLPCCSNAFCLGCITRWVSMKAQCPLCKVATTPHNLLVVCEPSAAAAAEAEPVAEPADADTARALHPSNDKLVNLRNLLLDGREAGVDGARRFLICSSYDMALSNLTDTLTACGVQFMQLKGNQYHIRNAVNRYKDGQVQALLVNVTDFGSGLNLENTTDVVLMHALHKEVKKQVIGRAQRSGRTTALRVWNLVHENERA